jgi:hypothetical protein
MSVRYYRNAGILNHTERIRERRNRKLAVLAQWYSSGFNGGYRRF